jgi:hypothetical protein
MAPQINTGLFMTPYNVKMWKANEMNPEWVLCWAFTQMIPIKTKADSNYMNAMSAVEVENKTYTINQLNSLAKPIITNG